MQYKKIIIPGFLLMCLLQLLLPAKMIFDQETLLTTGTEYKFRTRPVDPNDPFRGKYMTLSFLDNQFTLQDKTAEIYSGTVYVELTTDAAGFAQIKEVYKTRPGSGDYFEANVRYITETEQDKILHLAFPFNRYYMEEFKAPLAEDVYRNAHRDSSVISYALVHVKEGKTALKDVIIGHQSILELVNEQQQLKTTTPNQQPPDSTTKKVN